MQKITTHKRYYDSAIENIDNWNISNDEKDKVKGFIKDYEKGKVTNRISVNQEALIERILDYLEFSLLHIKKDEPNKDDIEIFFDNLIKNKIVAFNKKTKKYNGRPYSLKTKKEIISALVKFLRWKYPDKPELLTPLKIKINIKKEDYDFLKESEIDLLRKDCKNNEERFIISGNYGTGARIEEFLNIRYSDITMPSMNENFIKVRIRGQFSKTQGRTISIYYKHALEDFREYLKERERQGIKPDEPILLRKYASIREFLIRHGRRVLNKPVHCHQLRHSLATTLASRMNRQQLCIYFGWTFSSSMVDKYISRNGVDMKEADKIISNTVMEDLQIKLSKEEYERKLLQEQVNKMLEERDKIGQLIVDKLNEMEERKIKALAK